MMALKASMWPQDWAQIFFKSEKHSIINLTIRQEDGRQKGKNKICWLEDNIQGVPKCIWASIIHSLHHMILILTLEVFTKKEFMRI